MQTSSMEVKKFNSLIAAPVVVLNKQRRQGDKDGCMCIMYKSKQYIARAQAHVQYSIVLDHRL